MIATSCEDPGALAGSVTNPDSHQEHRWPVVSCPFLQGSNRTGLMPGCLALQATEVSVIVCPREFAKSFPSLGAIIEDF